MHFPKGYKGPGSHCDLSEDEKHRVKKESLKKLKHLMQKATAEKAKAAKLQNKERAESKFVSSIEPTYPGFKGEK